MRQKLIFLDIDGTLVGRTHRIPANAVFAINAAQANDHKVVICTGRAKPEIESHILDPGFDGLIAVSGAYIELDGRLCSESFIDASVITRVTEIYERLGVYYLWQSSKGMWATSQYLEKVMARRRFAGSTEGAQMWHDIAEVRDRANKLGVGIGELIDASKGTFLVPDTSTVTVDDVRMAIGRDLTVINGSMGAFSKVNGEVMIPGVTKGTGLRYAAEHWGVDIEDTIAIGDSDNDIAMLQEAGTAVAMGNGTESVKSIADFVTSGVDEGGIINAFCQLDLI